MEKNDNARVYEGCHCRDCGWPIISAVCSGSFADFEDAANWDWWMYCSNKSCVNHRGVGVFQDWPKWIVRDPKAPVEELGENPPVQIPEDKGEIVYSGPWEMTFSEIPPGLGEGFMKAMTSVQSIKVPTFEIKSTQPYTVKVDEPEIAYDEVVEIQVHDPRHTTLHDQSELVLPEGRTFALLRRKLVLNTNGILD
jgi:hypothetical protein